MPQTTLERIRRSKERGIAVYLTAFFLLLLIPVVGLAIDGGYAFVIQSRLSAAADSAALAAGRGINLSGTVQQAQTQATTQATAFFNADFPVNYMNTLTANRVMTPTFTVNTDSGGNPTGTLAISVSASVQAPTYFMRWLGIPSLTIGATGTATRKNLVMEVVLDKSASMGTRDTATGTIPASINSGSSSCEAMVYSTAQFIKYFSPYDTVGMISFDLTAWDDNDAGNDGSYTASTNYWESGASGLANAISQINCGSNTNTTAALYRAYQDIQTVNQKLAQNVIVLFTDGVPNAVNASFPVRTHVDSRMSPSQQGCVTGNGITAADVSNGCTGTCVDTASNVLCTSTVHGSVACPGSTGCKSGNQSAGGSAPGGLPVCTTTTGTVNAAIAQWANFSVSGGQRGAAKMLSSDSNPSSPSGCPDYTTYAFSSQTIAYIPNTDYFGNSTTTIQTGPSTTVTSPWFQWIYGDTNSTADHVDYQCAPTGTQITSGNSSCKNLGALWTSYSSLGAGAPNNTFQSGPYNGFIRPDTPNAIGTASMTAATNMAYTIRSDTNFNPIIDVVYLQGNGQDPVDRSFLQLVSNQQYIQPILYQANPPCPDGALATAATASGNLGCQTNGAFNNPYYQTNQQQGIWAATASTLQLESMFQQIASSLLRISQ